MKMPPQKKNKKTEIINQPASQPTNDYRFRWLLFVHHNAPNKRFMGGDQKQNDVVSDLQFAPEKANLNSSYCLFLNLSIRMR